MKSRRTLRILIPAVGLVGIICVVSVLLRGPYPCEATFENIREGMTMEEVIATVGGPPGQYSDIAVGSNLPLPRNCERWISDDGELRVYFREGRVDLVAVWGVTVFREPNLLERFQEWTGLW